MSRNQASLVMLMTACVMFILPTIVECGCAGEGYACARDCCAGLVCGSKGGPSRECLPAGDNAVEEDVGGVITSFFQRAVNEKW